MQTFSQTKVPYTVWPESNNLVLENCLTSIEDCDLTKEELELNFSQVKCIVFKRVRLKKSLLSYSETPFFSQIYTAW